MAESTNTIQKEIQDREAKERRELRRKRRQRNQILAFLTLLLFVCLIVAIIGTGVWYIMHRGAGKTTGGGAATTEETTIDNLFESEDEIVKPEETNTEPSLTPEQQLDAILDEAFISQMPLEDKVAGLFIVTPESITGVNKAVKAGDGTKDALNKYAVGGIVYTSQNMQDAAQFTEMVSNTTLYSRYALFTCVAEEGGSSTSLEKAGLADKTDSEQAMGTGADAAKAYEASGKIEPELCTGCGPCHRAGQLLKGCFLRKRCRSGSFFCDIRRTGNAGKGHQQLRKVLPGSSRYEGRPRNGHGFLRTDGRTACRRGIYRI